MARQIASNYRAVSPDLVSSGEIIGLTIDSDANYNPRAPLKG